MGFNSAFKGLKYKRVGVMKERISCEIQNSTLGKTEDDPGRDGGTNFVLRIKEQDTHLILHEHDDDDDDDIGENIERFADTAELTER